MAEKVTARLAEFVTQTGYQNLPPEVMNEARRSILNWLGVAIGASRHETVDILLRLAATVGGPPQAAVFGRAERVDALHAALINGTSSHIFDFDDTHLRTVIHPSGPVAPVVLALGEWRGSAPRDCLAAFALGVEVELRIGNAVTPEHYDVGWHITGTAGVFGAAVAAARLLGHSEHQTRQAIGLAATQPTGLREMFGTMTKPFHPGKAAMDGLRAGLLTGWGFTSSEQGIEAPRGFGHVLSTKFEPAEIVDGLGERWEILKNSYKPYPCGVVIHPVIDGVLALRKQGLREDNVVSIVARVHPLVPELTGKRAPQTGLEGKFSVFHCMAAALIDGTVGQAQFTDARVRDPRIIAVRDKTDIEVSSGLREDECVVRATLTDGTVLEHHIEHASGSLENPLSDEQLDRKFLDLAAPVVGEEKARQLIAWVRSMDAQPDLSGLLRAAVP